METFALYLIKSVAWLTGFALVFILFLRNERFFVLNRIYLIAGILTSLFFPFISIHYTVVLPVVKSMQVESAVVSDIQNAETGIFSNFRLFLLVLYVMGILFVLSQIIRQGRRVLSAINKSELITLHPVKLIRTPEYTTAFSFFSYVFVNPSITDIETAEIMNHEMVHIRQKHWLDLVLVELLCIIQWFNPLAWIYVRFMRQNHEYLADEVALQRTSDPAIYRAALLNQIVGAPVVNLANSFNYSLNKKRFNMMKNIIRSPYRKMKILLILPVFAIVLWAFAKPDYKYKNTEQYPVSSMASVSVQQHEVKGKVVEKDGSALPGASVVVLNTSQGISTDDEGFFKLDVPENGTIVVSFVGYKSKVLKPVFTSEMVITMVRDTLKYLKANISTPPPPPPPPVNEIKENSGAAPQPSPLPLINEVEEISSITPPPPPPPPAGSGVSIAGDKQPKSAIDKEVMVIVEALPEFIGGTDAMTAWINSNLKYPADAVKSKITGKVLVNFTVTAKGKIENVVVIKSISPVLDAEAKRVISSMPDWKPGMQAGKNVPVQLQVPVEFKLN